MKQVLILLLIGPLILSAGDMLSEAISETTTKAQIRYYSIQRDYDELVKENDGVLDMHHNYQKTSNAVGGYFGFESGLYYNFSAGATFYTSQPVFYNPLNEGGLQLLEDDQSGYSVMGEAFLGWEYDQTKIKIGRQLLSDYLFLSDMDIRMTPYTYEAAIMENRDLENITLRIAGVSGVKRLVDTTFIDFVNATDDLFREQTVERDSIRGDYNPAYYDANRDYIGPKKNLFLASMVYRDKQFDIEFWDYYCEDFVNFIYTTGSYMFEAQNLINTIGVQWVKQDNVGEHIAGNINTYAYGLMLQSIYENQIRLEYAFNKVKYDENSLDGGTIIDTWGNNLLYNSLVYNGSDQAGTISNSLTIEYDFISHDASIQLTFARFDLPNKITDIFADQDNNEYDLILKYTPNRNKKIQFKLEAIYVDFDKNYDFNAYEELHGFDILHMYDNIMDLRFVVNYTF